MTLNQEQIQFYKTEGYLPVHDVFDHDHIKNLIRRTEELCEHWDSDEARKVGIAHEPGIGDKASARTIRKMSSLAEHETIFRTHACHRGLAEMVSQLIGRPMALYGDQLLLKPPHYGSEKPPHQDNAYFKVKPAEAVITCWTALDEATEENGCMHYFSGSHLNGLVEHEAIAGTPHLVPAGVDLTTSKAVPMKAGGCIFHHSQCLHHSHPNRSDKWRRAYVCHFVNQDADFTLISGFKAVIPILE